jgi:hypothetical protein
MERFFGEEQEEFYQALSNRGFWVNRTAAFEARHATAYAVPTLMSPFYFDRVLSWELDEDYANVIIENQGWVSTPDLIVEPNPAANKEAREKNELVAAFNAAGFSTSSICYLDYYFYPTVNQFYNMHMPDAPLMETTRSVSEIVSFVNQVGSFQNLVDLLHLISPTPRSRAPELKQVFRNLNSMAFTNTDIERRADLFGKTALDETSLRELEIVNRTADALLDTLDGPTPRFMLMDFWFAHRPFHFDRTGVFNVIDADNPWRYPDHHIFSTRVLVQFIDMILDADPTAVIVLQSDHGLHGLTMEEIIETFGCSEDEAVALWNQVMSAVRLTEEMNDAETEAILSDPRNISRFLINTFIGENYQYIPPQFRQTFEGPQRP